MKILLCLSRTPDTTTKIKFTDDGKSLDDSGVKWVINPYDDHGMGAAMELKEKHNAHLTVIHVGEANADEVIRKSLAIGADEAIRVNAKPHDAFFVAQQIAAAAEGESFDLIITGRESIDFNGSAVTDMLGSLLNMPSFPFVTKIEPQGEEAEMVRFIDGGSETLKAKFPFIISATKELAEPKIPNMRGIMQAKRKPLKVVEPQSNEAPTEVVNFEPPQPKGEVKLIDAENAESLIDILKNEAKVI